jgi:hypothetical protein
LRAKIRRSKKLMRPPSQQIARHSGLYLSSQATQEAAVGRITVPGQPRQKKFSRLHLSRKNAVCAVCAYHPSYSGKYKIEGL